MEAQMSMFKKKSYPKDHVGIGRLLKNAKMMLGYFARFVPKYFYMNIAYIWIVSFVWVVTGPIFLKIVFDALQEGKSFSYLLAFLAAIALCGIARNIIGSYVVEYLQPRAFITVSQKMRSMMFEKAVKMDLAYYETPKFYTDFVWAASQAETKCAQLHGAWANVMARLSEMLLLGGVMAALDPMMIVLAVAAAVVRIWVNRRLVTVSYDCETKARPYERQRDYSQRIFYLSDYAKELRLSQIHRILYDRFRRASAKMYDIFVEGGKRLFRIAAVSDVVQEVCLTLVMLLYLSYRIIVRKDISLGDFAALFNAAGSFSRRMTQLVDMTVKFMESALYVEKFRNFMDYKPQIEESKGDMPSDKAEEICFEDVSFSYAGEKNPSLRHINMTIHPGEKIAIVGYNGAGKSTLVKLLMRLYDVTEGKLSIGGKDVKEFDTAEYRKQYGAVFQDFQIFAASLGENVAMDFVADEDRKKIADALTQSGFGDKLAQLEHGIDTPLTREYEENGVNLSGGEGQKTAIARVFFRPYKYVIMDEPSSALDPVSEYRLNEKMMELAADKTVIFISHRLSTTCMADRIFMLEHGRIIEEGSHAELMALGGKYAEMFHKQAEKYLAE